MSGSLLLARVIWTVSVLKSNTPAQRFGKHLAFQWVLTSAILCLLLSNLSDVLLTSVDLGVFVSETLCWLEYLAYLLIVFVLVSVKVFHTDSYSNWK